MVHDRSFASSIIPCAHNMHHATMRAHRKAIECEAREIGYKDSCSSGSSMLLHKKFINRNPRSEAWCNNGRRWFETAKINLDHSVLAQKRQSELAVRPICITLSTQRGAQSSSIRLAINAFRGFICIQSAALPTYCGCATSPYPIYCVRTKKLLNARRVPHVFTDQTGL